MYYNEPDNMLAIDKECVCNIISRLEEIVFE